MTSDAGAAYRSLLECAPEAVLLSDEDGKITFANHEACEIFGYTQDELVGLAIDALVPLALRNGHAAKRAAYLADPVARKMSAQRGLSAVRRDGTEFPIEIALGSTVLDGRRVVVSFHRDVSAERAAQQQIAEYQERLERMAFEAVVAEERERRRLAIALHDRVGQSLALAQIKLTTLRRTLDGDARATVDDCVQTLERASGDARSLTFDLSPPVLYDLGLPAALSWLSDELSRDCGMRVAIDDADAPSALDETSAGLLFRAVRELLLNVFKHSGSTDARVRVATAGQFVEIDVVDGGCGFDAEAATSPAARRGFGLLSVREQIRRLGGTMTISSAAGQGTRVALRAPLQRDAVPASDGAAGAR